MGVREKETGSQFNKSVRFTLWGQTYLIQYTVSNCGHWQTFTTFKGTVRVILPLVHHPRTQQSAVKGLPQSKVTSKPLNLITIKNYQLSPSLIYLVPFWTPLYFLIPQLPVATSSTTKLHTVRKSMSFCMFWSYSLRTTRGSPCWVTF